MTRSWVFLLFLFQCSGLLALTPCEIGSLTVTMVANGTGLTSEEVKNHVLQGTVFAPLNEKPWSCVDGRSDQPIFGTPAGDSGEFIMGLSIYEDLRGELLTSSEITDLFDEFMKSISYERQFYMHTDMEAIQGLRKKLNISDFDPADEVETSQQEVVLSLLTQPEYIGCNHIRLMVQNPHEYEVRQEIVTNFIRSYFLFMWNHEHSGKISHLTDYVELNGLHLERAVVVVKTNYSSLPADHECRAYGPQVPTASSSNSFFVYHSSLVTVIRTKVAAFFQAKLNSSLSVLDMMNELSSQQLNVTFDHLAKGEPSFLIDISVIPSDDDGGHKLPVWASVLIAVAGILVVVVVVVAVYFWWRSRESNEEFTPLVGNV